MQLLSWIINKETNIIDGVGFSLFTEHPGKTSNGGKNQQPFLDRFRPIESIVNQLLRATNKEETLALG